MKRTTISTAIVILIIALLSGCTNTPAQDPCLATTMSSFSQNLFREVLATGDENPVISPLSVYYVLAMVALGAQEDTLREFEAVLGMSPQLLAPKLYELAQSLSNTSGSTELNIAASVWFANWLTVDSEFNQNMIDYFNAPAFVRDMQDPYTIDEINNWVYDQTCGLIEEIVNVLPPDTIALLANTLYLDARWASQINPMIMRPGLFYLETGEEVDVTFLMSRGFDFFYTSITDYYEAVMLPYDDERLGLFLVRPTNGITIRDFVATNDLTTILKELKVLPRFVGVNIPILDVRFDITMKYLLESMGLGLAFDYENANFFGIVEENIREILYIHEVGHAARIEIDEEGTRAAAVTYAFMRTSYEPNFILNFNSPYVYMIYDFYTSTILFMGVVDNPIVY